MIHRHSCRLTATVLTLLLAAGTFHIRAAEPPLALPAQQGKPDIDFDRARQLLQRERAGQRLTPAEQQYLDRAKALRQQRQAGGQRPGAPAGGRASLGLVPLTEMAATDLYKGQDGGRYGQGRNEPPEAHLAAALRQAAAITPLDADGRPAADGKIVLISVGMSNTTQEFSRFVQLATADPQRSVKVVIVDGAQGGRDATDWERPAERGRRDQPSPWDILQTRLGGAGVTARQVQVVWIKQARKNPAALGEFPAHVDRLRDDLATIVVKLRERYPNLRLAYFSSRIYAGYAQTPLNPEPYAYESGFAVRALIQKQMSGDKALNHDPTRGKVVAPLLLWGPYLWADGQKPRKADGLAWKAGDFRGDGTHPSETGCQKVAELLLKFFKADATAKPWFLARDGS